MSTAHIIPSGSLSASCNVSYPLGLWYVMDLLVATCANRQIRPPDSLTVRNGESLGIIQLCISRDSYIASISIQDDSNTPDAPILHSGCHALLDAYESRAQGEPSTVSRL